MTDRAAVLDEILDNRFSCRSFTSDPVPQETLEAIFASAQRTASWCNSQAWQVDLLTGASRDALSKRLVDHVATSGQVTDVPWPGPYEGAYRDRRYECAAALYESIGIARDDKMGRLGQMLENFRFFGAPHVAIITSPAALGTYGVMDCGGYVANLLNAATAHGVGSIAQAAIAGYADVVRDELGTPEDRWIVCAVSFGNVDPEHPVNGFRTTRADLADVVTWR